MINNFNPTDVTHETRYVLMLNIKGNKSLLAVNGEVKAFKTQKRAVFERSIFLGILLRDGFKKVTVRDFDVQSVSIPKKNLSNTGEYDALQLEGFPLKLNAVDFITSADKCHIEKFIQTKTGENYGESN